MRRWGVLGRPWGGPKRGLLQEGSPEALQLLSHVKRNNAIPEKKSQWLAREAFFLFENLDLNRCALGCARGPVHPSLDPIWAPKGCDQEFRASRGPLWAVHPIQKGPPGRPFGRPEVAPEGLGAIFEMLKKLRFLYCFEPLDRSFGVKGAQKEEKWETRTHLANRRG